MDMGCTGKGRGRVAGDWMDEGSDGRDGMDGVGWTAGLVRLLPANEDEGRMGVRTRTNCMLSLVDCLLVNALCFIRRASD